MINNKVKIIIMAIFFYSTSYISYSQVPNNPSDSINASASTEIKRLKNTATVKENASERKPDSMTSNNTGGKAYKFTVLKAYSTLDSVFEGSLGDNVYVVISDSISHLMLEMKVNNLKIIPYIDGIPIKGTYPHFVGDSTLMFRLRRNDESKENWDMILRKPNLFHPKQVVFSIGYENDQPFNTLVKNQKSFNLIIFRPSHYLWIAGLLILLIMLLYFATKSDMLCEDISSLNPLKKRPYSLALSQMAFWFFLVITASITLFIITKEIPNITDSVLGLIGISTGTALGSKLITNKKVSDDTKLKESLTIEKNTLTIKNKVTNEVLENENTEGNKALSMIELQNNKDRLENINKILDEIDKKNIKDSKSYIKDILSDSNGISLHRFQIFAWTLMLGVIFILNVWTNLSMPEFSSTLMILMGISSGTYLGFKIPE